MLFLVVLLVFFCDHGAYAYAYAYAYALCHFFS